MKPLLETTSIRTAGRVAAPAMSKANAAALKQLTAFVDGQGTAAPITKAAHQVVKSIAQSVKGKDRLVINRNQRASDFTDITVTNAKGLTKLQLTLGVVRGEGGYDGLSVRYQDRGILQPTDLSVVSDRAGSLFRRTDGGDFTSVTRFGYYRRNVHRSGSVRTGSEPLAPAIGTQPLGNVANAIFAKANQGELPGPEDRVRGLIERGEQAASAFEFPAPAQTTQVTAAYGYPGFDLIRGVFRF